MPSLCSLALLSSRSNLRAGEMFKPRRVEFELFIFILLNVSAWCRHGESLGFAYGLNKNFDPCWLHPNINKRTRLSGVKDGQCYMNCGSLSKNLNQEAAVTENSKASIILINSPPWGQQSGSTGTRWATVSGSVMWLFSTCFLYFWILSLQWCLMINTEAGGDSPDAYHC